jgi:hypothetical protein
MADTPLNASLTTPALSRQVQHELALHSPPHVVAGQEHPADIGAHWRSGGHDRGSVVCEGDDMSGRPDYDVGDLVVCVEADTRMHWIGRVFVVEQILPPGRYGGSLYKGWGCHLVACERHVAGWCVSCFRKIDPKPPEFWTGEVEANQRDKVPA